MIKVVFPTGQTGAAITAKPRITASIRLWIGRGGNLRGLFLVVIEIPANGCVFGWAPWNVVTIAVATTVATVAKFQKETPVRQIHRFGSNSQKLRQL